MAIWSDDGETEKDTNVHDDGSPTYLSRFEKQQQIRPTLQIEESLSEDCARGQSNPHQIQ